MPTLTEEFNAAPTLTDEFNAAKAPTEDQIAALQWEVGRHAGKTQPINSGPSNATSIGGELWDIAGHQLRGALDTGATQLGRLGDTVATIEGLPLRLLGGGDMVDMAKAVNAPTIAGLQQDAAKQAAQAPALSTTVVNTLASVPVSLAVAGPVGEAAPAISLISKTGTALKVAKVANAAITGASGFGAQQGALAPKGRRLIEASKGALAGALTAPLGLAPYVGKVLSALGMGAVTLAEGGSKQDALVNTIVQRLLSAHGGEAEGKVATEPAKATEVAPSVAPEATTLSGTHTPSEPYTTYTSTLDTLKQKAAKDGKQITTEATDDPSKVKVTIWSPKAADTPTATEKLDKWAELQAYKRKLIVEQAELNAFGAKPKISEASPSVEEIPNLTETHTPSKPITIPYAKLADLQAATKKPAQVTAIPSATAGMAEATVWLPKSKADVAPVNPVSPAPISMPSGAPYVDESGIIRTGSSWENPSKAYKGPEIVLPKNAPVGSNEPSAITLPEAPTIPLVNNPFLRKPQKAVAPVTAVRPAPILATDEGRTLSPTPPSKPILEATPQAITASQTDQTASKVSPADLAKERAAIDAANAARELQDKINSAATPAKEAVQNWYKRKETSAKMNAALEQGIQENNDLLKRMADKAQAFIDQRTKDRIEGRLLPTGVDPLEGAAYGVVALQKGRELLSAGYTTYNEWASKMKAENKQYEPLLAPAWQRLQDEGSIAREQAAWGAVAQQKQEQRDAQAGKPLRERIAQLGRIGENILFGNQMHVGELVKFGHGDQARLASVAAMNANPAIQTLALHAIDMPVRNAIGIDFKNPDKASALLNWMRAKRLQEIDSYVQDENGNPTYMDGKLGTDRTINNKILNHLEEAFNLTPTEAQAVKDTANSIWANFHEATIKAYLDNGIISMESYLGLASKGLHYVPMTTSDARSGLDLFDPDLQVIDKATGKVVGIPGSGLKDLKHGGSERDTTLDILPIMKQKVVQAQTIIQRNEAFKGLSASAHNGPLAVFRPAEPQTYNPIFGKSGELLNPDNAGQPKHDAFGNTLYQPAPKGFTAVPFLVDGKQQQFLVADTIVKDIATMNPTQLAFQGEIAQGLSGLIKTGITGALNPTFGLQRHAFWAASTLWSASNAQGLKAYTSVLPWFPAQLGTDIAQILPEAIAKSGPRFDALKKAGGWQFQDIDWGGESLMGKLNQGMNSLNRTAGVLEQLALYNRLLKNGVAPEEAAARAIDYRNSRYVSGLVKGIDRYTGSYFSPAVTAMGSNLRSFKVDPASYLLRQAQTIAASAIATAALIHYYDKNAPGTKPYDQYSDEEKTRGAHIPIGLEIEDENGKPATYDYYVKLSGPNGVSNIIGQILGQAFMRSQGHDIRMMDKNVAMLGIAKALMDVPNPNLSTLSRLAIAEITTFGGSGGIDPSTGRALNEGTAPDLPPWAQHVSARNVQLYGDKPTSPLAMKVADNPINRNAPETLQMNPMHLEWFLKTLAGPGPFLAPLGSLMDDLVGGTPPDEAKRTWAQVVAASPAFRMSFTKRDPRQLYKADMLKAREAAALQHETTYDKFLPLAVAAAKEGPGGESNKAVQTLILSLPPDDRAEYVGEQAYIQRLALKGKLVDKEHLANWGMVNHTPSIEGKQAVFTAWINKVNPEERAAIMKELPIAITGPAAVGGLLKAARDYQASQ